MCCTMKWKSTNICLIQLNDFLSNTSKCEDEPSLDVLSLSANYSISEPDIQLKCIRTCSVEDKCSSRLSTPAITILTTGSLLCSDHLSYWQTQMSVCQGVKQRSKTEQGRKQRRSVSTDAAIKYKYGPREACPSSTAL